MTKQERKKQDDRLMAADKFRTSVVPQADVKEPFPLWHGWVIMEAFIEGAKWQTDYNGGAINPQ